MTTRPTRARSDPAAPEGKPRSRRDVIVIGALSFVCVGALAAAWPLLKSLAPDAALTVPFLDVDVGDVAPRSFKTVSLRGKPLWIRRWSAQSPWIVTFAICSRCGCVLKLVEVPVAPTSEALVCPCCNTRYDFAGKRTVAASLPDLEVLQHRLVSKSVLRIGG